jgi:glycosyltransferase involved in cell wall biosynthesis
LGGGERVTATMVEALKDAGFNVEIVAVQSLDNNGDTDYSDHLMLDYFGKTIRADQIKEFKIQRRRKFGLFRNIIKPNSDGDLLINATANIIPFVQNPRGSRYSILYFQAPISPHLYTDPYKSKAKGLYYRIYKRIAHNCVSHATIRSCSRFIAESVKNKLGLDNEVLYPPVDIQKFIYDFSSKKPKTIVVLSRFSIDKKLEFAIEVAKSIDCKMSIIGAITDMNYYNKIKNIAADYHSKISLFPNASLADLIQILKLSKAYLHCNPDEAFGISVVEAMAAGCIPVVPNSGGPSEFIPVDWQYSSLQECIHKIQAAFDSNKDVHDIFVRLSTNFSESKFKESFMEVVQRVLDI